MKVTHLKRFPAIRSIPTADVCVASVVTVAVSKEGQGTAGGTFHAAVPVIHTLQGVTLRITNLKVISPCKNQLCLLHRPYLYYTVLLVIKSP